MDNISFPKTWPSDITCFLHKSFGGPVSVEKLGGVVYDEGCFRVTFKGQLVIVKKTREPREWYLYKHKSHFLKQLGVNLPVLYDAYTENEEYWLILENVPSALPRNRWKADTRVLETLFSLHYGTWKKERELSDPYIPSWTHEMSVKALAFFPSRISSDIMPALYWMREQCTQIFEPLCWISGDPNPTNWGLRTDGTIVLFDWERAGYGHPAIDLAITMPGLGTSDGSLESLISEKYLAMWISTSTEPPFTLKELTTQIKMAKMWSTVEFLADNAELLDSQTLNTFVQKLPKILKDYCK